MLVPFNELSGDARIWIYQADRAFTSSEEDLILEKGREFLNSWAAHGQPLRAAIDTRHDHFVIIAVDNAIQLPSGCSIDQSTAFIRALEQQLNIGFFNRTKVSVWHKNSVMLEDLAEIREKIQQGSMGEDTLVFNNLIQSKDQLEQWIIPIKSSWLSRYFVQTAGN